jgi:hypothetical protein
VCTETLLTCRGVLADVCGHRTACVVATPDLGGVLPHQLCEVACGATPAGVAEAVGGHLVVPRVNGRLPGWVAPAARTEQASASGTCMSASQCLTVRNCRSVAPWVDLGVPWPIDAHDVRDTASAQLSNDCISGSCAHNKATEVKL